MCSTTYIVEIEATLVGCVLSSGEYHFLRGEYW